MGGIGRIDTAAVANGDTPR